MTQIRRHWLLCVCLLAIMAPVSYWMVIPAIRLSLLEAKLGHDDAAPRELVRFGGRAVPALIAGLKMGYVTSTQAAEALVQIGRPAVPALVEIARSSQVNQGMRLKAIYVLRDIGAGADEGTPSLTEVLNSEYRRTPEVAAAAAEALGSIGKQAAFAVPTLISITVL